MDANKGGDRGARRRRVRPGELPATYTMEEVNVVHPEENSTPRADEAFKMVSKAFECLSNEENRKIYDRIGSEEPVYETGNGGVDQNQVFYGFYDSPLDDDCSMQADPFDWAKFLVYVIIGAMAVLAFAPVFFLKPWMYTTEMSESYNISLTTPKGMNYYVQSADFEQQYPPNSPERVKIEQDVEADYEEILWRECKSEIDWLYWDNVLETPNCDALKRLKTVFS